MGVITKNRLPPVRLLFFALDDVETVEMTLLAIDHDLARHPLVPPQIRDIAAPIA
jgi:hypothetical protein